MVASHGPASTTRPSFFCSLGRMSTSSGSSAVRQPLDAERQPLPSGPRDQARCCWRCGGCRRRRRRACKQDVAPEIAFTLAQRIGRRCARSIFFGSILQQRLASPAARPRSRPARTCRVDRSWRRTVSIAAFQFRLSGPADSSRLNSRLMSKLLVPVRADGLGHVGSCRPASDETEVDLLAQVPAARPRPASAPECPWARSCMMASGFFAAACSIVDVASAEPGSMAMVSTSTPFFLPHSCGPVAGPAAQARDVGNDADHLLGLVRSAPRTSRRWWPMTRGPHSRGT